MQLIAISGKFNTVRHPHTVVTDGERAGEPGLTFRGQSTTMSASDSDGEDEEVGEILQDDVSKHLQGIEDGCGCAEMWEFLSDRRHEGGDSGEWGHARTVDCQPDASGLRYVSARRDRRTGRGFGFSDRSRHRFGATAITNRRESVHTVGRNFVESRVTFSRSPVRIQPGECHDVTQSYVRQYQLGTTGDNE